MLSPGEDFVLKCQGNGDGVIYFFPANPRKGRIRRDASGTFLLLVTAKPSRTESQSSQPDELIYSSTSLSSSASCYHCLLMLLASLYLGMHRCHRCFSTLNPYRISTDTRYWYQYWYVPNGIRSGRQPELQTQHSCHVHATEPKVAESFALLFSPQRLILTKK